MAPISTSSNSIPLSTHPPPTLTIEELWEDFKRVSNGLAIRKDYIKTLTAKLAAKDQDQDEAKVKNESKKDSSWIFETTTNVDEAYKRFGVKKSDSDEAVLEAMTRNEQPVIRLNGPAPLEDRKRHGCILAIALDRKNPIGYRQTIRPILQAEFLIHLHELDLDGFVAAGYIVDKVGEERRVVARSFEDVPLLEEAYELLGLPDTATDQEILSKFPKTLEIDNFDRFKLGALLRIHASRPRPNGLDESTERVLMGELSLHLALVSPLHELHGLSFKSNNVTIRGPRPPISFALPHSLTDAYKALGVSERPSWNEVNSAYNRNNTSKLVKGALLLLADSPPPSFSKADRERMFRLARIVIYTETGSHLANVIGMPTSLRDRTREDTATLVNLSGTLSEHLDRFEELENEIRISKSSNDELNKKLSAAMRAAKASKELDSVKGELSRANKAIEESEKRIAKWVKKLEGSNGKIDELEAELKKEKDKSQFSNKELKQSQDYIKVLRDTDFTNQASIGKSHKKLAESNNKIESLERELVAEKDKVYELGKEILAMEEQLKDMNKLLVDAQVQVETTSASGSNDGARSAQSEFVISKLVAQLKSATEQLNEKTNENLELLLTLADA